VELSHQQVMADHYLPSSAHSYLHLRVAGVGETREQWERRRRRGKREEGVVGKKEEEEG
jgi:hypothetical protein